MLFSKCINSKFYKKRNKNLQYYHQVMEQSLVCGRQVGYSGNGFVKILNIWKYACVSFKWNN